MKDNRKLPDGVEIIKEDIFWPEGRFSIRRGDLIWSKAAGWQKYYEVRSEESRFKTAEEAMAAWETSKHSPNLPS
jgi:hypothetical protein